MYEAGIQNDMLNLLYIENQISEVAVKTPWGISDRVTISDAVMQGTVFGSLKCTTSMDKICKLAYANKELQYFYKGDPNIGIGYLGAVDDLLAICICSSSASIYKNSILNSFIENERLSLSQIKSHVMHIGNPSKCYGQCPPLKVHDSVMDTSEKEKYLGDIVTSNGGIRETVMDRVSKGYGRVGEILGILDASYLGHYRVKQGLILRDAILCNGMLYSTDAWSALGETETESMEKVDTFLLSSLMSGHPKCPTEFHYLETGTLMIWHLITIRRLMYHYEIVTRPDNEVIKKIYNKQTTNSCKGDWIELLRKDFAFIGDTLDDTFVSSFGRKSYKRYIEQKVKEAAFNYYKSLQNQHGKVKNIFYD